MSAYTMPIKPGLLSKLAPAGSSILNWVESEGIRRPAEFTMFAKQGPYRYGAVACLNPASDERTTSLCPRFRISPCQATLPLVGDTGRKTSSTPKSRSPDREPLRFPRHRASATRHALIASPRSRPAARSLNKRMVAKSPTGGRRSQTLAMSHSPSANRPRPTLLRFYPGARLALVAARDCSWERLSPSDLRRVRL